VSETALEKVLATVHASLDTTPILTEDLLDIEYLRNHYDVSFVDFMCCLAFAAWVKKKIRVVPWFGTSIMILKNCQAK
jgi:hypothetical protein